MRQITALRVMLLLLALGLALLASPAAAQSATIDVELGDFYIEMPATLTAGSITFNMSNVGSMNHTIAFEGNGVNTSANIVSPGADGTFTVDLEPGTYVVYCPVGQHRQAGMELTFTVTAAQQSAATTPAAGATALPNVPQTGLGGSQSGDSNAAVLLLVAVVIAGLGIAGTLAYRYNR